MCRGCGWRSGLLRIDPDKIDERFHESLSLPWRLKRKHKLPTADVVPPLPPPHLPPPCPPFFSPPRSPATTRWTSPPPLYVCVAMPCTPPQGVSTHSRCVVARKHALTSSSIPAAGAISAPTDTTTHWPTWSAVLDRSGHTMSGPTMAMAKAAQGKWFSSDLGVA